MPDKMIQIVPIIGPNSAEPFGFYGLDDLGRLWYGRFDRWGTAGDDGPGLIVWRRIDGKSAV